MSNIQKCEYGELPKSLGYPEVLEARKRELLLPHIAPLTQYVKDPRVKTGSKYDIPDFDPHDGGFHADCLFLLMMWSPKTANTCFMSRDNPDETAKNIFLLMREAGIDRNRTVQWNIVPWIHRDETKISEVAKIELLVTEKPLSNLLALLPSPHTIVLVGGKATSQSEIVASLAPEARICTILHFSPSYIHQSPENREVLLEALRKIASGLPV